GLTDEEISRTRASYEIKKSQKVDLKVDEITINGDQAQAVGRREDVITLKDGQRLRQDLKFTYTLKRGARGWVIQEAREYADRPPLGSRASDPPAQGGRRPEGYRNTPVREAAAARVRDRARRRLRQQPAPPARLHHRRLERQPRSGRAPVANRRARVRAEVGRSVQQRRFLRPLRQRA